MPTPVLKRKYQTGRPQVTGSAHTPPVLRVLLRWLSLMPWTRASIAKAAGVSSNNIANWSKGGASINHVTLVGDVLGLELCWRIKSTGVILSMADATSAILVQQPVVDPRDFATQPEPTPLSAPALKMYQRRPPMPRGKKIPHELSSEVKA